MQACQPEGDREREGGGREEGKEGERGREGRERGREEGCKAVVYTTKVMDSTWTVAVLHHGLPFSLGLLLSSLLIGSSLHHPGSEPRRSERGGQCPATAAHLHAYASKKSCLP